jgi:hypothetical protein
VLPFELAGGEEVGEFVEFGAVIGRHVFGRGDLDEGLEFAVDVRAGFDFDAFEAALGLAEEDALVADDSHFFVVDAGVRDEGGDDAELVGENVAERTAIKVKADAGEGGVVALIEDGGGGLPPLLVGALLCGVFRRCAGASGKK